MRDWPQMWLVMGTSIFTVILFMYLSPFQVGQMVYNPQPNFMDEACKEYTCVDIASAAAACEDYATHHNITDGMLLCLNYEEAMALGYPDLSDEPHYFLGEAASDIWWFVRWGWWYFAIIIGLFVVWMLAWGFSGLYVFKVLDKIKGGK